MKRVTTTDIESVYREHHERLWRALLAYTGDADVASDAEAEVFAQALRRGEALRDPAAWVWRSAFLVARGMLADRRLATRVRTSDTNEANRASESVRTIEANDASNVTVDDHVIEMLSMLDPLSEQQRAAMVLRYVGGYRPSEIATILRTSPGAIRVQLHRAHQTLRKTLETP
jgi:RNA polymerase sigma factor (sigma-70 family)